MAIFHDYVDDIPALYTQPTVPVREQPGSVWIKGVNADVATLVGNVTHNGHFVGVFGFSGTAVLDPNDPIGVSVCRVDGTLGAFALTIYPATGSGRQMIFKKVDAVNAVAITPDGTDTIDGVGAAYSLAVQYDSLTLIDTATGEWSIICTV